MSVQYYCAASLDGYIAEIDDTIEWLTGYEAVPPGDDVSPVEGGYDDFYADAGALVSGPVTYEFVVGALQGREWVAIRPGSRAGFSARGSFRCPRETASISESATPGRGALRRHAELRRRGQPVGRRRWKRCFPVRRQGLARRGARDRGAGCARGRKPLFDRRLPGGPMRLVGLLPFRAEWSSCATKVPPR